MKTIKQYGDLRVVEHRNATGVGIDHFKINTEYQVKEGRKIIRRFIKLTVVK